MKKTRSQTSDRIPATFSPQALRETQIIPQVAVQSPENWAAYIEENKDKLGSDLFKRLSEKPGKLYDLAKIVTEMGGWLKVTGLDKWQHVDSMLSSTEFHTAKIDYQTYLLPIEKKKELLLRYQHFNPFNVSCQILKFDAILPIPVFYPPENGIIDDQFWSAVMDQDIAILRGFTTDVWPLNQKLFSVDTIESQHSEEVFDVLSQDREPDCCATQVHTGKKSLTSIKQYIKKMRLEMESGPDLTTPVEFGVNIDIGKWTDQIDELRKVMPKKMIFGSCFDALDYVRSHVYGMTLPQIYLKTTGCWTGAHQENLNFAAINVNHGPGVCEWWGLDPKYNNCMRREIRERLDFDCFECETLWWPDENYLMSRGFISYHGYQQPGDIVFVGPATMHWVKSHSPTVNSAWNFGNKSLKQFEVAFQRDSTNRKIAYESLVHIYTLSMDLLNAELGFLPDDLIDFLHEKLELRFRKEKEVLKKLNVAETELCPEHQVLRCDKCKQEIFMTYAVCDGCENEAFCLNCVHMHNKSHTNFSYCATFPSQNLETLLERVKRRKEPEFQTFKNCYIPGLSSTFSRAEKYRRLGVWCSPWTGSADNVFFRGVEKAFPKPPKDTTKEIDTPKKRYRTDSSKTPKSEKRRKVEAAVEKKEEKMDIDPENGVTPEPQKKAANESMEIELEGKDATDVSAVRLENHKEELVSNQETNLVTEPSEDLHEGDEKTEGQKEEIKDKGEYIIPKKRKSSGKMRSAND